MKKILSVFLMAVVAPCVAVGAVNVKKADSVKPVVEEPMNSATSLVPGVLTMYNSIKDLNAQQQQLVNDCKPTSDEIRVVNELIKEWAKIGDSYATGAISGLGNLCSTSTSYSSGAYKDFMERADRNQTCYEAFNGSGDKNMIWEDYPRVSSANICQGSDNKNCRTVSNIYEVFSKISFNTADYTADEAARVAKLVEKSQKCAPSKVNAAKLELWGGFLTQTLGGMGKKSGAAGTDAVIQAVSSMGGSGGIQSMLPSLGQMATQAFEK